MGVAMTSLETMAAEVLDRNVKIAKLMDALKLGRAAVVESFDYAETLDDKLLAASGADGRCADCIASR